MRALHAVFEASPDPVFASDRGGALLYGNRAAKTRWGDTLERLTAKGDLANAARAVLESGTGVHHEWGERSPAGVRAWFATTISPLVEDDKVVGYTCVCTDVTELKRSEERLRRSEELMVDTQGSAHLGTWEWDITQPTATWSAELYRIYGLSPEEYTPSYEAYLTKVHPDDRERVMEATNKVFHEHVPYSHDERIRRPDGSIRHLHTWAHPVLDTEGKLVRLVGVCQDVTDRVNAEERARELNVDLERRVAERTQTIERSMRDLEAFNSMVSHDLRAPLAVIQLCADMMLRETELPDRVRENTARILKSIEMMNLLVEDLLGLARVGNVELQRAEIDISTLCRVIVEGLCAANPSREASVRIEPSITCVGDAGLVRVALTNLLSNAWKFAGNAPRTEIDVSTIKTDRIVLAIRDNGVGFDMKDAGRLFGAFQRLHRTEEFPGTGVGLATVHRIVERHGGRIWAESSPGAGATFFIELPSLIRRFT